jgi:hypothetical protein
MCEICPLDGEGRGDDAVPWKEARRRTNRLASLSLSMGEVIEEEDEEICSSGALT